MNNVKLDRTNKHAGCPLQTDRASGFTLLEALLAMTMAVTLSVVLLDAIVATGKTTQHMQREIRQGRFEQQQVMARLERLVRADLLTARTVMQLNDQLVIEGFNALDPVTLQPTQLPAKIVYRINNQLPESSGLSGNSESPEISEARPLGQVGAWLVRDQTLLTQNSDQVTWTIPLIPDVANFGQAVDEIESSSRLHRDYDWHLRLVFTDVQRPAQEFMLVLR